MTNIGLLLRRPADRDDTPAVLAEILVELRELRCEVRVLAQRQEVDGRLGPPVAAIRDYFGPGRFTVAGLLDLADDKAMRAALADAIDLDASPRSRPTALGALLARLPEVEVVAQQRGVAVYRLSER